MHLARTHAAGLRIVIDMISLCGFKMLENTPGNGPVCRLMRRTSFKFPWSCPQFRRLRSSRTLRRWRVLIHFDTITVNRSDACMRLLGCCWLIQQIIWGTPGVYGGNLLHWMRQDAIESLSPEQKAFAKAFRALQLESTLFGILAPRTGSILWEDIGWHAFNLMETNYNG